MPDFIDKSGEPRSKEDLEEASRIMRKALINMTLIGNPEITIQIPTILDALKECLERR